MDNLRLWNEVCVTNPKYTKDVTIGARKYTSISPQSQLKKATEAFGIYGEKWGLKEAKFSIIDMPNQAKVLVLNAVFFAPNILFPISSSAILGEWKDKQDYKTKEIVKTFVIDTDVYKKVETDVTTKALSKLGFNADVFMGMFSVSGYVATAEKIEEYSEKISLEGLEVELAAIDKTKDIQAFYLANRWISTSQQASAMFNKHRKRLFQNKRTNTDATK